jgi:hypothetical protein
MSALLLIGACFAICLIATPFLAVIWLLHKWAKWVQGMINGSEKSSDAETKAALKLLSKLIK